MKFLAILPLIITLNLTACAGGSSSSSGGGSNEGGSSPINGKEETAYKRAINKCYKTGGSRVVKVEGQLMCY